MRHHHGRGPCRPAPTLSEFLEQEYWPAKQGLSFTTLRGYRGDVRRVIAPALGDMPIDEIGHREIQAMLNTAPSRKAAKHARGTLSSALSLAVDLGAIESNPALGSFTLPTRVPREDHPLGEWLTDWGEINRVLDAARERDPGGEIERICLAGLGFGLRKGEILGLDGGDFDLEGRVLHVRRSYTRWKDEAAIHDLKTKESRRDIPILEPIAKRLMQLDIDDGPFVTYNGHRSNPSSAAKHFRAFRNAAGLPEVTMASMRHSFATAALHSGMDVKNVQAWLGHTDPSTTLRNYCHSDLSALQEASAALSAKLQAAASENPPGKPEKAPAALEVSLKGAEGDAGRIMELMLRRPDITREELADELGTSLSTVKRRLSDLERRGAIARVGGRKGGLWAVFPALLNRYRPAA